MNAFLFGSGISPEELSFLQHGTSDLTKDQQDNFFMIYSSKRKSPQAVLLCTLLGFIGIAGVQRFVVGQVGMGLLYFFTGGICWIGTIIDLVNYKSLTLEYNQKMAYKSFHILKGGV